MAEAVYLLCSLTAATCMLLLFRGYFRTRTKLLLWSALCFLFLTMSNILVYLDLVVFPEADYALIRALLALIAVMLLLFGMIWEAV